jgi:hypothetical protein
LAGLNFSGSLKRAGDNKTIEDKAINKIINPVRSLVEK